MCFHCKWWQTHPFIAMCKNVFWGTHEQQSDLDKCSKLSVYQSYCLFVFKKIPQDTFNACQGCKCTNTSFQPKMGSWRKVWLTRWKRDCWAASLKYHPTSPQPSFSFFIFWVSSGFPLVTLQDFWIETLPIPASIQFHLKTQNQQKLIHQDILKKKFPFVWARLRECRKAWQDIWLLSCVWRRRYFRAHQPAPASTAAKWVALLRGRAKDNIFYFMCYGKREC